MTVSAIVIPFQTSAASNAEEIFQRGIDALKENNPVQAREILLGAAVLDHAPAQFALGLMYLNGQGGDRDEGKGQIWIELSATNKYGPAVDYLTLVDPENINLKIFAFEAENGPA